MAEQNKFDKIRAEAKADREKKTKETTHNEGDLMSRFYGKPQANDLTTRFYGRQKHDQNSDIARD